MKAPADPQRARAGTEPADGPARFEVVRRPAAAPRSGPPVVAVGMSGILNVLRCIAGAGGGVTLVSFDPDPVLDRSRAFAAHYRISAPEADPEGFIEGLIQVGRAQGGARAVLYYCEDGPLLAVSRNRERLSPYYLLSLPPPELVEDMVDKGRFARLAARLELPVPVSLALGPDNGYATGGARLRYPLVLKPLSRVGWFRTTLFRQFGNGGKAVAVPDSETLARVLALCKESGAAVAVQELVAGPEANILSYHAYLGADGAVLGEFTGRKHRTYPTTYGLSSCVEVCDLPEVRDLGRAIAGQIGLRGACKLDFKRDSRTGALFLLEINPRYNLWHYPGMAAGVNLPMIAYRDQAGLPPDPAPRARHEVLWVQGAMDRCAVAEQGRPYWTVWLARLPRRTVFDVWSWRDPLPFLAIVAEKVTRRLGLTRSAA